MSNIFCALGMLVLTSLGLSLVLWPLRKLPRLWLWALLASSLAAFAYWQWGGSSGWLLYQQQVVAQQRAQTVLKNNPDPAVLVQKLRAHLQSSPRSARGWYLLGRLYASQQHWEEALQSFERAYTLKPNDSLIAVNYAEALFARHHDRDEKTARRVLMTLLVVYPNQADALALLAMDAQQHQQLRQALGFWKRLLALVPEHSAEATAIRKAILKIPRQE